MLIRLAALVLACVGLSGCIIYLNPQCIVQIHNGDETDIDCSRDCSKCQIVDRSSLDADCDEATCNSGTCTALPCANSVKDGAETDVDCGGGTCRKCAGARACQVGTDCFSGMCVAATR